MRTPAISVVKERISDHSTIRTGTLRHAASIEGSSSPVRNRLLRTLAVFVLSGTAVLGQVSLAHAQAGGPFNATCDDVGMNGRPYVPGVNCRFMSVDGYRRRYIVFVPPGGVPAGSPTVVMLHGASGDGGLFLRNSGWREKATRENFVAIFPTAVQHFVLDTQRFSTRWNNYDLPIEIDPNRRPAGYPLTSPWPADDVKFIRQIAGDTLQRLSTDPHRFYVAGFSSGGGMCARLGVEASDLIAAVACHSSGLHQVHETRAGSRNLSAFFSIGTLDGNALEVINDYLLALGQPPITELPLDPAALDRIPQIKTQIVVNLDSFNLKSTPLTTVTGPTSTRLRAQTAQPGNNDGNEFYFTFLKDVPHQYPDDLPDLAWPFFLLHPRP
jgi:poly(3-hydroxybutyrate) depolymerase